MIGWSAGKDSTALTYLVVVHCGAAHVRVVSEKDDLDYPGEEEYVTSLAAEWGAQLAIVRPSISPLGFLKEAAARGELRADDEIHARSAALSKACFYGLMDAEAAKHDLLFMGLRAEESKGRRVSRRVRGLWYPVKSGRIHCCPLGDWRGIDVYAYLLSRGIELLPLYQCIGLMHRDRPWMIRKSWWTPGTYAKDGGIVWLRRYYPSLYRRLVQITETARQLS
jgi:3'-phosphoadenosine 5'-phosphosulfate sulfotransferase (PAPS reductase)/FAD synthetase